MTAPAFSEHARDYFAARGIRPDLAVSVGVLERQGRLLFPYRAEDGMVYHRVRALNGESNRGSPA